jgi:signal transduction histidine kinase
LDFNSFSVNQFSIIKEPQYMNTVIEETTYQWRITQEDERIQLNVHLLDEDELMDMDGMRLKQVLINLLNNAKQSIEQTGTISVTLQKERETIGIIVKDSGVGIPYDEQDLIFERFYRGENKKFKVRGLGLGLPFSRMIAKALGGDLLLVESSPEGSTFIVILPIVENKN